jgi:hypothetical protein
MTVAWCRNSHSFSRLAALLGVAALLVRCVIAPGLMPDLTAAVHGTFKLVICSGAGAKILAPAPDGDSQPAGHHDGDSLCSYAAFGHVATPPAPILLSVCESEQTFQKPLPQRVAFATRIHKHGARAPPSTA